MLLFIDIPVFANTNSTIHWGIPSSRNEIPPFPGDALHQLTKKYQALYIGNTKKKHIYLTFDNGYENGFTPRILDVLKKKKVPATFFITGQFVREHAPIVKRMVKEGHMIGNHTWHHPQLTTVNDVRFEKELRMLEEEVAKLTTQKKMKFLRPPEGIFSEKTLKLGNKLGYTHVFWSLAFKDWEINNQHGWQYSYDNITRKIHPGAIILLHTISSDNANALERVIEKLSREGYEFKSLQELMKKKKRK
jgi:peptidoglycan-N-acetylmuramic acid deacetylase